MDNKGRITKPETFVGIRTGIDIIGRMQNEGMQCRIIKKLHALIRNIKLATISKGSPPLTAYDFVSSIILCQRDIRDNSAWPTRLKPEEGRCSDHPDSAFARHFIIKIAQMNIDIAFFIMGYMMTLCLTIEFNHM